MELLIKDNPQYKADIQKVSDEGGIYIYRLSLDNTERKTPEKFSLMFNLPSAGMFSVWNPGCGFSRALEPNWRKSKISSRLTSGAPVHTLIGMDGNNRLNISVLDFRSPVDICTGVMEDDAVLQCYIEFFTMQVANFEHYETLIRIDMRNIPFYQSIKETGEWWEKNGNCEKAYVPETARLPLYSVWYSFHQDINVDRILDQCRLSKELGMDSVIIDDGWQTDDNNRGYAYCGDWEVAKGKVGDMREFAEKVHETGLKFMIWYSVPFVGLKSEAIKRFQGMILTHPRMNAVCLDPRYKEVREYLIGIYENAVRDWNLDGLKLDFIDSFKLSDAAPEYDEKRDIFSLEEAVDTLLRDINTRVKRINPEICIEFRQSYTGPGVAVCGNMLRVGDCPADSIKNRLGSVDLRMLSGKTPVHSDMIMWDMNDTAENAALQIINSLFCVPQISVLIDKLPKEHYDMLKFYLDFWIKHRSVLLDGELKVYNPEANYSLVSAENDKEIAAAAYSLNVLKIEKPYKEINFVNGTGKSGLIIENRGGFEKCEYTVTSCTGKVLEEGTVTKDSELLGFNVPPSGVLTLKA